MDCDLSRDVKKLTVGKTHRLLADRSTSVGLYLTDGKEDVLLPWTPASEKIEVGETVKAFVYRDSEDRLIATLKRPRAEAGQFARLKVVDINDIGIFLDWGLERDLLLPYREVRGRLEVGDFVFVRVVADPVSDRMTASERIGKFLSTELIAEINAEVPVTIWKHTEGSTHLIVDQQYHAVAAQGHFAQFESGETATGYVYKTSEGLPVIGQRLMGHRAIFDFADTVLEALDREHGFIGLSDKSSPEDIRAKFGVSKSDYKKAIGTLMKRGEIDIEHHGIRRKKPKA